MDVIAQLNKRLDEEQERYRGNLIRVRRAARRAESEAHFEYLACTEELRKELAFQFKQYLATHKYLLFVYIDGTQVSTLSSLTKQDLKPFEIKAKLVTIRIVGSKYDQLFLSWTNISPTTGSKSKITRWIFASPAMQSKFKYLVY